MTDTNQGNGGLALLACEAIVWRLITKKKFWDQETGDLLPDVYFRRPPAGDDPKDTDGLSVSTKNHGDLAAFEQAVGLSRTGGVASLHTGHVRSLDLDIIPDSPEHANIQDLPFYYEDDKDIGNKARAERLAGQLVAMSRPNKK